jgi:hypothetical protein
MPHSRRLRRRILTFIDPLPLGLGPRGPRHPRLLPRTHRRPGRGVTHTSRYTNSAEGEGRRFG